MVLEATMICLDNSEWMRNGDFIPTRMEAQHDAVNLICGAKTQQNAENTVGIMTMSGKVEVLVSLTADLGKVLTSLHNIKIGGCADILAAMQVAQLALKNRQNKSQQQRLIMFIASPIKQDKNSYIRMAKRLKKNNISVDIINFGEDSQNMEILEAFVSNVNNSNSSHLVNIPPGPHILSDALVSSPIIYGEGGAPVEVDPELAEALRLSLVEEEQRARREAESTQGSKPVDVDMADADDDMAQAIALSMDANAKKVSSATPSEQKPAKSIDELSEDEQMALALSMSLQSQAEDTATSQKAEKKTDEIANMMNDPEYVNSIISNLEGVDPNDELVKSIMANIRNDDTKPEKKDEEKK